MAPGTPFGPGIRSLLTYLHHSHHVGFERLSRLAAEMFGLTISQGAIATMFQRLSAGMATATDAIREKLRTARIIASDETTHVLRDVQYAIDCGDTIVAPTVRDHLRWAIGVGRRRHRLKDTTLASYAARADLKLSGLMHTPVAHPAGKALLKQVKAWRTKFFVFLTGRDVPATNNISEREIRPSVVFRKVTGGFRFDWGAGIHAGYRSVTGTARLRGQSALGAIRDLVDGSFAVA